MHESRRSMSSIDFAHRQNPDGVDYRTTPTSMSHNVAGYPMPQEQANEHLAQYGYGSHLMFETL